MVIDSLIVWVVRAHLSFSKVNVLVLEHGVSGVSVLRLEEVSEDEALVFALFSDNPSLAESESVLLDVSQNVFLDVVSQCAQFGLQEGYLLLQLVHGSG